MRSGATAARFNECWGCSLVPVTIRVTESPEFDLIHKTGSLTLEYGVRGGELENELRRNQELFVRSMELQGLTLYRKPGFNNPVWVTNEDGSPLAYYGIDWEGKRRRVERRTFDPITGTDRVELPTRRETSLEDSQGEVEYRIVGIFWGPKTSIEIAKSRDVIIAEEKASKHPIQFGPSGMPIDTGRTLLESVADESEDIL